MILAIVVIVVIAILFSILLMLVSSSEEKSGGEIERFLPSMNCGACGYGSCKEFAKAVSDDHNLFQNCRPGGKEVADKIAVLFGLKGEAKRLLARILCARKDKLEKNFDYEGITSCSGALMLGHPYKCEKACLNMGDCIRSCQFNAIVKGEFSPVILKHLCTGCGSCVKACPIGIIELYPEDDVTYVKCKACKEKFCEDGCVSCKICKKDCPKGAINLKDGRPVIDYEKCINCRICMENCPRGVMRKS